MPDPIHISQLMQELLEELEAAPTRAASSYPKEPEVSSPTEASLAALVAILRKHQEPGTRARHLGWDCRCGHTLTDQYPSAFPREEHQRHLALEIQAHANMTAHQATSDFKE